GDDQSRRAGIDVPVNERGQRVVVDTAVVTHGRDKRNQAALEHGNTPRTWGSWRMLRFPTGTHKHCDDGRGDTCQNTVSRYTGPKTRIGAGPARKVPTTSLHHHAWPCSARGGASADARNRGRRLQHSRKPDDSPRRRIRDAGAG